MGEVASRYLVLPGMLMAGVRPSDSGSAPVSYSERLGAETHCLRQKGLINRPCGPQLLASVVIQRLCPSSLLSLIATVEEMSDHPPAKQPSQGLGRKKNPTLEAAEKITLLCNRNW